MENSEREENTLAIIMLVVLALTTFGFGFVFGYLICLAR